MQGCNCGRLTPLYFSFRRCWRNALLRCWGDVRYGVYLFAVRRLFMRAGMHCGKVSLLCFFFRCCCAVCSVGARLENILFYRMEKAFCFFAAHNTLAATQRSAQRQRKGDVLCSRFFALALLQNGIIDQRSKTCSVLHCSQTQCKRSVASGALCVIFVLIYIMF